MAYGLVNITSATTTTLIAKNDAAGSIRSVSIANCSSSNAVTVTLFLDADTTQTSYIENVVIPTGTTLFLDNNISFDNSILSLKLTTVGTSPDVNVIIK